MFASYLWLCTCAQLASVLHVELQAAPGTRLCLCSVFFYSADSRTSSRLTISHLSFMRTTSLALLYTHRVQTLPLTSSTKDNCCITHTGGEVLIPSPHPPLPPILTCHYSRKSRRVLLFTPRRSQDVDTGRSSNTKSLWMHSLA